MERFAKIVNGLKLLPIFVKSSILNVSLGSEYNFDYLEVCRNVTKTTFVDAWQKGCSKHVLLKANLIWEIYLALKLHLHWISSKTKMNQYTESKPEEKTLHVISNKFPFLHTS